MTKFVGNNTRYELRRQRMVERLIKMKIHQQAVLEVMEIVPRHLFVEEALNSRAYDDFTLPIGFGQTISQPYTVARMTELLCGNSGQIPHRVLEIGTGCGYQTAVLEQLGVKEIYSIERLQSLCELAKDNLARAKYLKSRLKCGDGYLGWPQFQPFDGIIISAAPKEVPIKVLQQLAIGGRMVLPLERNGTQELWLIEKFEDGFQETCVQEANFVPLVSDC